MTDAVERAARPLSEWSEEDGDVLWWCFPIDEPPYVGTPHDLGKSVEISVRAVGIDKMMRVNIGGWPGYHTHWTPIAPTETMALLDLAACAGVTPADRERRIQDLLEANNRYLERARAATAEIARLNAYIIALEAALRPFVVPRDGAHSGAQADGSPVFAFDDHAITVGDFRRARAALASLSQEQG